ncbi:hypothetical protein MMC15_005022 [Xylographa vitiligo]|nr:hypothetical protein [Xylographa vitiligo]
MDYPQTPSRHGATRDLAATPPSIQSVTRLKTGKPARIDIPSFSAFQAESRATTASPVRRKPVPPSATPSPRLPSLSSGGRVVAVGEISDQHLKGNKLRDSPSTISHRLPWQAQSTASPTLLVRDLDQFPRGHSPNIPQSPGRTPFSDLSADQARQVLQNLDYNSRPSLVAPHARIGSEPILNENIPSSKVVVGLEDQSTAMKHSRMANGLARSQTYADPQSNSHRATASNESLPAPRPSISLASNKLTSFFSWKGMSSPVGESSPTTISDRSNSPAHSPRFPSPRSFSTSAKPIPSAIDVPKANAPLQNSYFPGHPIPPPTPAMSMKMEEMEEELKEISAELASSIRREMELEDEVERLQQDAPIGLDPNRRTSDYFSDSGTSSVRYPLSEYGNKSDDLEKMKRRSEQEKAQLKLDVSQKLQEERGQRKALEAHIKSLEQRLESAERDQNRGEAAPGRIRELEVALEDNRRRLQEERQHKENFEDLLQGLRGETEGYRNERDNLRDETVPQLRARVEGLEADRAEFERLTYDNTKMYQELQALKNENTNLRSPRFQAIVEEHSFASTPKSGLNRTASLARGTASAAGLARSGSLSRSNSIAKDRESRESLADRVKEIEMQRDALHQALRSLLDRQKYQNREHDKRVKALEQERDRALEAHSPRRRGYEKEVKDLRFEINELRRRADDALEQKWQCEKNLGGLKKDLERAEQETGSLRTLLQENDIPARELPGTASLSLKADVFATSASLEKAYKDLQATQAISVSRLGELKGIAPSGDDDDDATTIKTMDMLIKTMSEAETERDLAQTQAATYRAQAASLQEAKNFHEGENVNLADQLRASADRVEALASQVRLRLDSNSELRAKLAEAVGRGERDQKASATRINKMQDKLKALEDRLMAAQQHSEETVLMHEEEVKEMRESHNLHLQRMKSVSRSPTTTLFPTSNMGSKMSPRSPRSPMLAGARSPRLGRTSSGIAMTMTEALRTEFLEKRVAELERALREADKEMQEVVQRMNQAQIEVMELQSARDEAMKSTRNLQTQIIAENEKVGGLMRFFS